MKLELEHSDIIKACAFYLSTQKNFQVEPLAANFPFKLNAEGELECMVRNGDMGPPPRPARQPIALERAEAPAPTAVPRKVTAQVREEAPPKNDMFHPVPEPLPHSPPPKMRYLDEELAGGPPLSGHFSEPAPPTRAKPSGLILDPSELSEDDRAVLADVLSRSQRRAAAPRVSESGVEGSDGIVDEGDL